MSKRILALALALITLLLVGCQPRGNDNVGSGSTDENDGGADLQSPDGGFVLKAVVTSVNPDYIEVEVIESDYAFGVYWVRTGDQTEYKNADGSSAKRDGIKVKDTVNITYSGQVMMSYPPQIVALSVEVI